MNSGLASPKLSWVKTIWPIQRFELKKVLPLLFLKFLVSIVYSILTCLKETLIVTAEHSGAEVIPVIKAWIVFPLSILCAIGYAKLSNHFKRSTLFYGIVSFFLIIVFLYGFVFYPNANFFSPTHSSNWLTLQLGAKHTHLISIYRYWIHTLFFVTSELWGQVVIILLYWGFANHIFQIKEAKKTYTLFIAAGDLGTIVAGPLVLYYVRKYTGLDFSLTLQALIFYVLFFGIFIMGVYWWTLKYVLTNTKYYNPKITHHTVNEKTKLSLWKSVKHIFSSKYLLAIAVLVIGVSLTANIIEVTWKAHLKQQYPTAAAYQAFNAKQIFWVGIFAFITVLFFGNNFLRRFGWRFTAQITPIAIGATGAVFFLLCIFKNHLFPLTSLFGITPLFLIVLFGAFQSIINKVTKYSFFDSTKEIVYIPLDEESKVKGKAAIDLIGSRFGKSGASWIQLIVIEIIGTGSILFASPYFLPIIIGVTFCWIYSVRYLDKELTTKEKALALEEQKQQEDELEREPSPLPTGGEEKPEPTI